MAQLKSKFTPQDLTVITYMKREFIFVPVEQGELRTLASGYNSVHFGLAGIFFGSLITLIVTWTSVSAALSDRASTAFLCSSLICFTATLYFGCMAWRDYRNSREVLLGIKTQTMPVIVKPD
jgi:hypothetical protein